MHVLVIGDVVTDVVAVHTTPLAPDSDTPARITTTGGGAAANTAAWLAHAGVTASLVAVVGDDAAGAQRLAELVAAGVGCAHVRRSRTAPTGTVVVLTGGHHRTMLTDRGANHDLRPSDVDAALDGLPDVGHVHLSGYTLLDETSRPAGRHALAVAASRGLPASVDAASAAPLRRAAEFLDWIAGAGLVLANQDEARVLAAAVDEQPAGDTSTTGPASTTAAALARALAARVPEVVVKLGPAGAVWARGETVLAVPARPVTLVDTTGAGDAFAAGLLAARLAGADPAAALDAAVRLGALAVSRPGGRPPLPGGLISRDR